MKLSQEFQPMGAQLSLKAALPLAEILVTAPDRCTENRTSDPSFFITLPADTSLNTLNTLRMEENGRHFADVIFKCIFLNENIWISLRISLKFVPKGPFNNIPALVQIMACRLVGAKPLSEPMVQNGLALTRRQAIIWTNDGLVYWHIRHSASMC